MKPIKLNQQYKDYLRDYLERREQHELRKPWWSVVFKKRYYWRETIKCPACFDENRFRRMCDPLVSCTHCDSTAKIADMSLDAHDNCTMIRKVGVQK